MLAVLVPRRDDLDDGHHSVGVTDGDSVRLPSISRSLGTGHEPSLRGMEIDGDPSGHGTGRGSQLEGDDIRLGAACLLLDHGEVARGEAARVKGIAYSNSPSLVKVVEPIGKDAGPVVDWHGAF